MSDINLKPCPFCGGKCEIDRMGTNRVSMKYRCGECGCSLETGETWPGDKCQWNERHGDAMQARIDELESALKGFNLLIDSVKNEQLENWFDALSNYSDHCREALEQTT